MARTAPKLGGGTATLDAGAFEAKFNMALVHETVRAELNARRQGTASTKTRGQVSGGGAKPWRQKGTGRARAGSSRSPIWVGGGTVFGPQPRHYIGKVNRKARRAALRSALSVHAERGSLAVFDASSVRRAVDQDRPRRCWTTGAPGRPTLVLLAESRGPGRPVVPQSDPGGRDAGRQRGRRRRDRRRLAAASPRPRMTELVARANHTAADSADSTEAEAA